jgi:hypothetical protein
MMSSTMIPAVPLEKRPPSETANPTKTITSGSSIVSVKMESATAERRALGRPRIKPTDVAMPQKHRRASEAFTEMDSNMKE